MSGGEISHFSSMDNVQQLIAEIPKISRYWCISVLVVSVAVHFKVVPPQKLFFNPDLAFGSQPWRLVSSFFYLGDLLVPTLFNAYTNLKWTQMLEQGFSLSQGVFPDIINTFDQTKHDHLANAMRMLQPLDYLYYLVLMGISVIFFATLINEWVGIKLPLLGLILNDILLYISCRTYPNLQVNIMGIFDFGGYHLPYISFLLDWLGVGLLSDIPRLMRGDISVLYNVLMSSLGMKHLCTISLGHFWWFTMEFLVSKIYLDSNAERQKYTTRTPKRIEQARRIAQVDYVKNIVRLVLLPPWYWPILHNINTDNYHP